MPTIDAEQKVKEIARKFNYSLTHKQFVDNHSVLIFTRQGYELQYQRHDKGRIRIRHRHKTILAWEEVDKAELFLQELHGNQILNKAS